MAVKNPINTCSERSRNIRQPKIQFLPPNIHTQIRVTMRWWEQEGMYLEEMRMAAQEAERREGGEELGGAETATDD